MDPSCPLVLRKFPVETSDAVMRVLTAEDSGLSIVQPPFED